MTSILFLKEAILSETKNIFALFFTFSKFNFNFEHFQKLDNPHIWCIFKVTDSEKRG